MEFVRRTLYFVSRSLRWARSVSGIFKRVFQRETWAPPTFMAYFVFK